MVAWKWGGEACWGAQRLRGTANPEKAFFKPTEPKAWRAGTGPPTPRWLAGWGTYLQVVGVHVALGECVHQVLLVQRGPLVGRHLQSQVQHRLS